MRINWSRFSLGRFLIMLTHLFGEKTLQREHDLRTPGRSGLWRRKAGQQHAIGLLQAVLEVRHGGYGVLEPAYIAGARLRAGIGRFEGDSDTLRGGGRAVGHKSV